MLLAILLAAVPKTREELVPSVPMFGHLRTHLLRYPAVHLAIDVQASERLKPLTRLRGSFSYAFIHPCGFLCFIVNIICRASGNRSFDRCGASATNPLTHNLSSYIA